MYCLTVLSWVGIFPRIFAMLVLRVVHQGGRGLFRVSAVMTPWLNLKLTKWSSWSPQTHSKEFYGGIFIWVSLWPSLKSALRPPPSALAESANFRPFYVKRADFSPPPPATKKRRKLVKIRPRCPHLATKKRRKVVKIRPCGGWWVGGWPPPLFA